MALCHRVTLDSVAHRWVPARTTTVHRCPTGKAWVARSKSREIDSRQTTARQRQTLSQTCFHKQVQPDTCNHTKKVNLAEDAPPLGIRAHRTNILIWRLFMSASMMAAIQLGPDYTQILEAYKNTNFEELLNLFDITQKLVHKQGEILDVKTIEWTSLSWTRSTLSHDQVMKWTKAKVRVYSDSALCLGK